MRTECVGQVVRLGHLLQPSETPPVSRNKLITQIDCSKVIGFVRLDDCADLKTLRLIVANEFLAKLELLVGRIDALGVALPIAPHDDQHRHDRRRAGGQSPAMLPQEVQQQHRAEPEPDHRRQPQE